MSGPAYKFPVQWHNRKCVKFDLEVLLTFCTTSNVENQASDFRVLYPTGNLPSLWLWNLHFKNTHFIFWYLTIGHDMSYLSSYKHISFFGYFQIYQLQGLCHVVYETHVGSVVKAYFNVLFWHMPGGTVKYSRIPSTQHPSDWTGARLSDSTPYWPKFLQANSFCDCSQTMCTHQLFSFHHKNI